VVDEGISESFQRPCPELNFKRSHRVAEIGDYTPPPAFGHPLLRLDEFYKEGCQEKSFSSTGVREHFCLEIQPTSLSEYPSTCARGFASEFFHSGTFIVRW